jgi:hypothetical protein
MGQATSTFSLTNNWNSSYPRGGNYWSDYYGDDVNRDGIGDSPYRVSNSSTLLTSMAQYDYQPWMGNFQVFKIFSWCNVDVVSNSTVEDLIYVQSNNTIKMHVSNRTADQSFGFCRIRIPHFLMNEPYYVLVDDEEPYYVNYNVYDDGGNRWIYFIYLHSKLEIVILPEFSSVTVCLLFMIAVLLITKLYKRKL